MPIGPQDRIQAVGDVDWYLSLYRRLNLVDRPGRDQGSGGYASQDLPEIHA